MIAFLATAASLVTWHTAEASFYTPESSGGPLACTGQRYDSKHRFLQGVANKTLPCGAKIRLLYRGRRVTVRVVDCGPFSGNREFDLLQATAVRLHFTGVGEIRWRRA